MSKWTAFPLPDKVYVHTAAKLKKHWDRLHRGDCEPFPKDGKAQAIYANYLDQSGVKKLRLFEDVVARAETQQKTEPRNANAYYLHAYALGRYSQGISIVKALSQGLGGKVKASLEQALKLQPAHATGRGLCSSALR